MWRINISFTNAVEKRQQTLWPLSILIGCLHRTNFGSHFSLAYFSGLNYILTRQILYFRLQSAPHTRKSDNYPVDNSRGFECTYRIYTY